MEGGEDAYWNEDPGKAPVLAYGYCCSKGRRPGNEDRIMVKPRLNGCHPNSRNSLKLAFFLWGTSSSPRTVSRNSENNLYGVFDGHGGPRAADFAAEDIPRRIAARMQQGQGVVGAAQGLSLFQEVFQQVLRAPPTAPARMGVCHLSSTPLPPPNWS